MHSAGSSDPMSTELVHSKILREAARTTLRPMGLIQKGRSRTWLDDNGWWLCVVEFQPSGWSRGSYLNVGCTWLWGEKDYLSFDEGYRVANFEPFENVIQFGRAATDLAERAAAEVARYRTLFQTVQMVSRFYLNRRPDSFWPSFNAGVACGLAGHWPAAREFFARVIQTDDNRAWALAAREDATRLDSLVNDKNAFRELVLGRVVRTRQMLKLPARESPNFE